MTDFRADLHCHSTCSDGSFTPLQLVQQAKAIGLSGLSITDHDTVAAYQSVLPIAKEYGIDMIVGAEFSTEFLKSNVHVLGYGFSPEHQEIIDLCNFHTERRKERNNAMLKKLRDHNMPIEYEEVVKETERYDILSQHTIGRPHIALLMLKKGYVSSIEEAFKLYLGDGQSCYVPSHNFSTEHTIDIIHRAGGFAILAHPHLKENTPLINNLLQLQFDGLEGYYAKMSPEQNQRWVKRALKKGWIITGGSDFHGSIKPNIPLGCSWVDEKTFYMLARGRHV